MDLSFVGPASRKSSMASTLQNKQNSEISSLTTPASQTAEKSFLTVLKENMQNQERQRKKQKMEREVKNKEAIMLELTNRTDKLEKENHKLTNQNKSLSSQVQELRSKMKKLEIELQSKEKKYKAEQERAAQSSNSSLQQLRQELKRLEDQNAQLKNSYAVLAKDHKVIVRRLNASLDETKKELEGKLSVRERQQKKIEEMFECKREENEKILQEKEGEIQYLKEQIIQLRQKLCELKESQQHIIRQHSEEITTMIANNDDLQQKIRQQSLKYESQREAMKTSLQFFAKDLDLQYEVQQSNANLLQKYKTQLLPRKIVNTEQIQQLKKELSATKTSQKNLQNKIALLEEEIKFIKSQKSDKQSFVTVLKEHLQSKQPSSPVKQISSEVNINKYKQAAKSQLLQIETNQYLNQTKSLIHANHETINNEKLRNLIDCKSKVDHYLKISETAAPQSVILPSTNYKHQTTHNYHIVHEEPTHKRTMTELASLQRRSYSKSVSNFSTELCRKKAIVKNSNDFLKEQLEKKKRSLVHIMYRRQQDEKQNCQQQPTIKLNQTAQGQTIRKRSSSMNELVSMKCKQRVE